MQKLCLFTKFLHQKIGWNYGILRSESFDNKEMPIKFIKKLEILCSVKDHYT